MTIVLNWGILGAGNISASFVHDLVLNNKENKSGIRHIIRSIGTSSLSKGTKFVEDNKIVGNNFDIIPEVQGYDSFYKNDKIDIVYVGTPHPFHKDQVKLALTNDKHVLCEKPITMNGNELEELVALAKEKNKFLMEAVWTRFFPLIQTLKEYIFEKKVLGKLNRLFVDYAADASLENLPETSRLRDINLGGGTLLDIGIYTLTYGRILLDNKIGDEHTDFDLKSFMTIDPVDKVDYTSTVIIKYKNGTQGILTCSNYTDGRTPFARLEGSKGSVEISGENCGMSACPKKFKISFKDNSPPIEYEESSSYIGFIHEANAVARDIAEGKLENHIMPLDESKLVMSMLDRTRKENDFKYPQDV